MAKRLTATEKWDKAWYRKLSPKHKALWQYLCDKCDQAGMWEIDLESASHFVNDEITTSDLKVFGPRLEKYNSDKLWIVDFVDFQCGELSPKCPAHKPVFKLLTKYKLLNRVLHRVSNREQEIEKEIEKEKEIEIEKEEEIETPENFDLVPRETPKTLADDMFEPLTDEWFAYIFDEMEVERKKMAYRDHDIEDQLIKFKSKVRGSPADYIYRDTAGVRSAFDYHLRNSKPQKAKEINGKPKASLEEIRRFSKGNV
jgi:hypothetical protein